MKTCETCRAFVLVSSRAEGEASGECRRRNPSLIVIGGTPVSMWPPVEGKDWCRDFLELER